MRRTMGLAALAAAILFCVFSAAAQTSGVTCDPVEVSALANRIHVRCATPVTPAGTSDAVRFFSVGTADPHNANRFLSLAAMALVTGQPLFIQFPDSSATNTAGCATGDCRTPISFNLF